MTTTQYILSFFIFCIVLFLYLHIHFHLKTSNDLEVYELDSLPPKEKMEEICDFRQPVKFMFDGEIANKVSLEQLEKTYGAFDIQVRDLTPNQDDSRERYLPFLFREGIELFRNDTCGNFITERNSDFLNETGVLKEFRKHDLYLRPPMVSACNYDFICGGKGLKTPLQYMNYYRHFIMPTFGACDIILIPPVSSKYLNEIKDYEYGEYASDIDPWNPESNNINFEKAKIMKVRLEKGEMLYIPAYWWYSISLDGVSSLVSLKYRTYMNTVAISPTILMEMLQKQNIRRETIQKMGEFVDGSK
jgi:hypothetical protein